MKIEIEKEVAAREALRAEEKEKVRNFHTPSASHLLFIFLPTIFFSSYIARETG